MPTHHPHFYDPNGSFIFQVEDTLYKLSHHKLEKDSKVFHMIFELAPVTMTEGTIDEDPIFLAGATVDGFDLYLKLRDNQ